MFTIIDTILKSIKLESNRDISRIEIRLNEYHYSKKTREVLLHVEVILSDAHEKVGSFEYIGKFVLFNDELISDFEHKNKTKLNEYFQRFMAILFPYIRESIFTIANYFGYLIKLPVIDASQIDLDHVIMLEKR
ncbi:hypothetical protein IM774_07465 [Erysipelotrichaceae bacterium RD49]|nr:hypothetical protein [Erysipelotrichaceae bacterium RD49]